MRFVKLDASKSPFFVGKLQIQTLPTACAFIDGVRVIFIVVDERSTVTVVRRGGGWNNSGYGCCYPDPEAAAKRLGV